MNSVCVRASICVHAYAQLLPAAGGGAVAEYGGGGAVYSEAIAQSAKQ